MNLLTKQTRGGISRRWFQRTSGGTATALQLTNMYSRLSLRQLSLAARFSARSYTSSFREGSVAASKEFGYVSTPITAGSEQGDSEPLFL